MVKVHYNQYYVTRNEDSNIAKQIREVTGSVERNLDVEVFSYSHISDLDNLDNLDRVFEIVDYGSRETLAWKDEEWHKGERED